MGDKAVKFKDRNGNVVYPCPYWPMGSVYVSVVNVNPKNYFGGEWEPFAIGKTLVGVDTSQAEFNTVEKTGGEKSHKLTIDEMPNHDHNVIIAADYNYRVGIGANGNLLNVNQNFSWNASAPFKLDPKGGNQFHNNLQPYITVYFWKRIA